LWPYFLRGKVSELAFIVHGEPIPQGSTKAFIPKGWSRPVITADNKKTKPWRQQIAGCALAEMEKAGFSKIGRSVGVRVVAIFQFARPKSVKRLTKTTKPDVDKLARAALDALTGVVFEDDAQVVELAVRKSFGAPCMKVKVLEAEQVAAVPIVHQPIREEEIPF
jgi:crossover junction endodeoxyribonuclease RusA